MSIQTVPPLFLDFFDRPIVLETCEAPLSSDAGLLAIRQFDERIGLTRQFADALRDPRDPQRTEHSFLEMTRSRIYGILAGYEDQNDHDTLRTDPVFKLIADRAPNDEDLASQPTLSRYENNVDIASLKRLRDEFIDQFIHSFATPPRRLVFDLDPVDDPAHGNQQLVMFHGFFEQHQYFPLIITSADTDQAVMLSLRHGTAAGALGADDDLEYLTRRLRAVWPDVVIVARGDAAFGVPYMYEVCERLGIFYTFGIAGNAVLHRETEALLAEAQQRFQETGEPQRLFHAFLYQAGSWSAARWVIAKVEAHAQGTNRRYVVSNRPGAPVLWQSTYDEYIQRGESENRNKEMKCQLGLDRLSDHRFKANYFRLYLQAAALNLLVRLRREIADPPPVAGELPLESQTPAERHRYARRRRQHDPLGEGQPCTWRTLLIKVAASVIVSTRRVVVRLSGSWPHVSFLRRVLEHVLPRPPVPHFWTS